MAVDPFASQWVNYTANDGVKNNVTVRLGQVSGVTRVFFIEAVNNLTAGNECTQYDSRTVHCSYGKFPRVYLGDGNDTYTGVDHPVAKAYDGPGDDVLTAGPNEGALLQGDTGNDTFRGGGHYREGDSSTADALDVDTFSGGGTVDYGLGAQGVNVSLDGIANDGRPGEGDNVGSDMGSVIGGAGANTITGNDSNNELTGGPAADLLSGAGGNDNLIGHEGPDTLQGGAGDDTLFGFAGFDALDGGVGGYDVCYLGPGETGTAINCELVQ